MNDHTLKALEFDKIREFLSSFAVSEGGKRRCRKLSPVTEYHQVKHLLDETTQMRAEVEQHGNLPLNGIHDIGAAVERAQIQNFFLDAKVLFDIGETLETAEMLRKYFSGCADTSPLLFEYTSSLAPLTHLTEKIRKCISPQGEILDTASSELSDIRRRIRQLRRSIIKTLENLLGDEQKAYAIQDDFITLRNNRYVIPVRSDSKTAVPGVVHDQSQSKATFFIEPLPVVEMNNELQILHRDEYYEEIRILTDLTSLIAADADAILHTLAVVETIDLIHAKALFSKALSAVPASLNRSSVIALLHCRHPILLARCSAQQAVTEEHTPSIASVFWTFDRPEVVPIDIIKRAGISTLIITGANAGGKTVAMKTLGLFVLMTQAGLHIPAAAGSELPVFEKVFADIGDEQNIEANLSTFSSHICQIKDITAAATENALVLLDELGSGTDPGEGGALALAILDFLRQKRCCTVVTTHLNLLKNYAYTTDDVENVSVAFDPQTFRPLYSLVYGVPGFSNALAIAQLHGISDDILTKAGEYLNGSDRHIAELIHGLEKTHQDIIAQKKILGTIIDHAKKYLSTAERFCEALKQKKEKILKEFEVSARKLLRESEQELKKLIREQRRRRLIRPDNDFTDSEATLNSFSDVKKKLAASFPIAQHQPVQPVETLSTGQNVMVVHLNKQGTVISADNASRCAVIAVGSVRVKAGYHELSMPHAAASLSTTHALKQTVSFHAAAQTICLPPRVNVIGLHVDEALSLIEKAIDHALMQGVELLEIIHGIGTGRLKQAIHEYLKNHDVIARFESAPAHEGGSGVTRAYIK